MYSRKAVAVKAEIVSNNSNDFYKLISRFITYLDVSNSSVHTYSYGVKYFLEFISKNNIRKPSHETVLMYKKEMISRNLKPSTIALYLSSIRRFFSWCEAEGLYENITAGVKSPKMDNTMHKKDAFSAEQLKDILQGMNRNSLEEKRNFAIFALVAGCGLRTIEVIRADIGDIRTVQGVPVLYIQGKGKVSKSEFVQLSKPVFDAIKEYLAMRGKFVETEPLFTSCSKRNRNGRLTTRTISSVLKKSMVRAGYNSKRLTAHSLRHSAVTLALMAGLSLEEVQAFARHRSVTTTLIYSHHISRLQSKCESAIASAIF